MRPGAQRIEEIEEKTNDLAARINEFPNKFGVTQEDFSSQHYTHIARNIAQLCVDYLNDAYEAFSEGDLEQEERDLASAREVEGKLDWYFELLELFPEYREAEFHTEEGMFPDLEDWYIHGSKKRLKASLVEKIKEEHKKFNELREEIIKRTERYQKEEPLEGDSMYMHISGNLIASYDCTIGLALDLTYDPSLKRAVEWLGMAEPYAGLIETYFELLDNFPEFRKAELTEKEGFFPDLRGLEDRVRETEKRLKG